MKNEKGQKRFDVHRLVALDWVSNPDPEKFKVVNHKDEDRYNNYYLNLEWCDTKYNNNYGTKPERIRNKLKGRPAHNRIKIIDLNSGIEYASKVEAYEALGISYHKLDEV